MRWTSPPVPSSSSPARAWSYAPPESSSRAGVVAPKKHRWARGQVPYTFAPDLPDQSRARVDSAIARIQARAFGVTFKPRTIERDYILFRPADDCLSEVEGREGGESVVWLGEMCGANGVIHELLHVLGFRHEQNRCDRDKYVTIIWSNIEPTQLARHQFEKSCGFGVDLGEYDEASIMHYSDTAFGVKRGVNGALLKTIQSRRGRGYLMGQLDSLSTMDIRTINTIYPPHVPDVSVSYPGGSPTVSWGAPRAAVRYTVNLVGAYTVYGKDGRVTVGEGALSAEGSTTELSFADTQNRYSGKTHCDGHHFSIDYYYDVTASYPDGLLSPATRVPAMVAPEGRC